MGDLFDFESLTLFSRAIGTFFLDAMIKPSYEGLSALKVKFSDWVEC